MFNKYIKIVLSLLIFALSIQQFIDGAVGSTGNGIMLILLSLVFVFLFFRNEFLLLAFFQLRKQNLDGANRWLIRIKNPKSALTTKQQGYYNYLKGLIISQENMNQAEKYFRMATVVKHVLHDQLPGLYDFFKKIDCQPCLDTTALN